MKRRIAATALAVLLLASLTGCIQQQTMDELEAEARFVKTCEDAGGHVGRYGFSLELMRCNYKTGG